MIRYIVLFLIGLPSILGAQVDVFKLLRDATNIQPTYKGVDSIIQHEYVLKLNHNYSVDTTLTLGGKPFEYQHDQISYISIDEDTIHVTTTNKAGDTLSQGLRVYNEIGILLRDKLTHREGYLKPMDRDKRFYFDADRRMIGMVNKLCSTCEVIDSVYVSYGENGRPDTIKVIKNEIGTLSYILEGDRYNVYRQLTLDYIERLKQFRQTPDDLPQEYIEIKELADGAVVYKAYKEDKSTGGFNPQWSKIRNADGYVTDFKYYKEGIKGAHTTYEVDSNGTILKVKNEIRNNLITYEHVAPRAYTYRKEGSADVYTEYNDKKHWVKSWSSPPGVDYYEKWSTRTYFYK